MTIVDLRASAGIVQIARDVVRVHGPEALGFLQGQLSQDVEAVALGASTWSLLLQPTGKVDAWLRVTRQADDALLLDIEAGFGAALLTRLTRFKLRTKADLDLARWVGMAVRGPGADDMRPAGAWPAGWPGVQGWDWLDPTEVSFGGHLPVVPEDALEALRIECGVPAMGAELTPDTIPAEAGQWLIDASVSFTKGCFTGQELVARIDSRGGKVPRPIRGLRIEGDAVSIGAPVVAAGQDVGAVTSSAVSGALGAIALAPLARSVEVGAAVEVAGRPATVTAVPMR